MKRIRFILLLIIVACGQTLWAGPKIDTLYFNHGDRVTGEVLDLSYNRLRLKTDDAGTLKFEWNKMDSVMILNTMRIVLDNGKILYGQVHPGDDEGTGTIRAIGMAPMWLYLSRIVSLTPMEERILDRLGGAFSSGFSYTKSSDVMQFNINSK